MYNELLLCSRFIMFYNNLYAKLFVSLLSGSTSDASCKLVDMMSVDVVLFRVRRTTFINSKYKDLRFFDWHPLRGNQLALNQVHTAHCVLFSLSLSLSLCVCALL